MPNVVTASTRALLADIGKDLAEDLTAVRLIESLRSTVCPACGEVKTPRKSLCARCWSKLPGQMRSALYHRFEDGYDRAMLHALRRLGCTQLIGPDDRHAHPMAQLPVRFDVPLKLEALKASMTGTVCPVDCGNKSPGLALCPHCFQCVDYDLRGGIIARQLAAAPIDYAAAMFKVLRHLRARAFHYPSVENTREA